MSPQPSHPPLSRAVALHRAGRPSEAAALYREALAAAPDDFDALQGLAVASLQQGSPAAAAELLGRALARRPDAAETHSLLGLALAAQGRHEAAIPSFERAIALAPDLAGAHGNLGLAWSALGRYERAVPAYERAVALAPGHAASHRNLGLALLASGRSEAACAPLAQALALDPRDAAAAMAQGDALAAQGRDEAALACFRRALAIAPGLAAAHANIGTILEAQGRLDAARAAFEAAVARAPLRARFYHDLAEHHRFTEGDPHLAALEAMAGAAAPAGEDSYRDFALAKAYADLGRHADSFRHLLAANAAERRRLAYDERATLDRFARIAQVFTPSLMAARAGAGDPAMAPVFIVGMPRSGTSLVEQILASHPRVFGAGELDAFAASASRFADRYPEGVASLPDDALGALGAAYVGVLAGLAPAGPDVARITDKMPANFRFCGLIHLALPRARIIHVRRDPVDLCLSCFAHRFTGAQPHTYDLAELGRYHRGYERLMAHWRDVLPAGVMIEIGYEALVAGLEGEARRLLAHCGLDWDARVLAFHRTRRKVGTASATQVRRPIYPSSVGRASPYREWLGPLIAALGP